MSGGHFDLAIDLLAAAGERLAKIDSDSARVLLARAQMLQVVAVLHTGDTSSLPSIARELHAGGADTITAIDDLLTRWAGNPSWAGARLSALSHKYVLLGSLGRDDELVTIRAQLEAELQRLPPGTVADADEIIGETREALLL